MSRRSSASSTSRAASRRSCASRTNRGSGNSRLQLEAVRQLHQQLLAVAQREGVLQLRRLVAAELVEYVATAAVDHVQVGQRRQLVTVTHLETEIAQAEVLHRLVDRHRRTVRIHPPG